MDVKYWTKGIQQNQDIGFLYNIGKCDIILCTINIRVEYTFEIRSFIHCRAVEEIVCVHVFVLGWNLYCLKIDKVARI